MGLTTDWLLECAESDNEMEKQDNDSPPGSTPTLKKYPPTVEPPALTEYELQRAKNIERNQEVSSHSTPYQFLALFFFFFC